MQNYETVIVMLVVFLAFIGTIMLVTFFWLLRQIQRSLDTFMTEVRKNSNMQGKTFDRSFAETNGELKKISYRLENVAEQLRRIQEFLEEQTDESKSQNRKK